MRRSRSLATRSAAVLLTAVSALTPAGPATPAEGDVPPRRIAELPVFERPSAERLLLALRRASEAGDLIEAERNLRQLHARFPSLAEPPFALAALAARRGQSDAAVALLRRAASNGLRGPERLAAAKDFESLRERPEWPKIEAAFAAEPPPPRPPRPPALPSPPIEGAAIVAEGSAEWSPEDRAVRTYVAAPSPEAIAAYAEGPPGLVAGGRSEAARRVNRWFAEGRAAGNRGDFYENRDGDHAALRRESFPQLTPVEHGPAAVAAGWDRGVAPGLVVAYGREEAPPLIGNSSTAIVSGPLWRSQARHALTQPGGPEELWRQYASNQLYVYPEHKDHDAFQGDAFHAATPYSIVTQGSSWSDQEALKALALSLAAFRPETKARLIETRLIAPTLQMLFRRSQDGIGDDDDAYLSPRAHPTAFDPERLDVLAMVERAQALAPDAIPPVVRLRVVKEDRPTQSVTLFGQGLSEALFDTPSAVARAHRTTADSRSMTVSAAATEDPNGRPLSFRWVLLRGDPDKVSITPLGDRGTAAEIEVAWHERTESPILGLRSQRVDIGVFADNGAALSAPAFVSVAFPPRQRRVWDAEGRLEMIDYDAVGLQDVYADPELWPVREWRDVYAWDADGRPLGWRREGAGRVERFTRHGARVEEIDAEGRPVLAERMLHPMPYEAEARRRVRPVGRGAWLTYRYDDPSDRQGVASPAPPPPDAAGEAAATR